MVTGMNRTGLDTATASSKASMIAYAQAQAAARAPESDGSFEAVHMAYIEEAECVGTVPVPATVKAIVASRRTDRRRDVLIDKLGERLAFERAGTRLYEAMLLKCGAPAEVSHPIDVAALAHIRDDEEMHFRLLHRCMEKLGADPTAMTPCADVVGVQGLGLMQVISDPRTTVGQALNALLSAELSDNAGWALLIELAEHTGHEDMATDFNAALQAKQQHLAMVGEWLRQAVLQEAT